MLGQIFDGIHFLACRDIEHLEVFFECHNPMHYDPRRISVTFEGAGVGFLDYAVDSLVQFGRHLVG
ncbi:MAG: hypothetical protein VX969_05375 [Verrucomicrobiota bacterium]|nr:hypothetical protein [Verrucomicrobiota bacterium]